MNNKEIAKNLLRQKNKKIQRDALKLLRDEIENLYKKGLKIESIRIALETELGEKIDYTVLYRFIKKEIEPIKKENLSTPAENEKEDIKKEKTLTDKIKEKDIKTGKENRNEIHENKKEKLKRLMKMAEHPLTC